MIIKNGTIEGTGGGGSGLPLDGSEPMEAPISFEGASAGLIAPADGNLSFTLGDDIGTNFLTFLNASGIPVAYLSSLGSILTSALTCVGDLDAIQVGGGGHIPYTGEIGHLQGTDDLVYNDVSKTLSVPVINVSEAPTAGAVLLSDAEGDGSWSMEAPAHADADGDTPQFANIVFSSDDPPEAGSVPEGTLWVKYIPDVP